MSNDSFTTVSLTPYESTIIASVLRTEADRAATSEFAAVLDRLAQTLDAVNPEAN